MTALTLIDYSIIPLKSSDTIRFAIDLLLESSLKQLPVVEENIFLGILSLSDIEQEENDRLSIGDFIRANFSYASNKDHIYEVMRAFSEQSLTLFPVLDENNGYSGSITLSSLIRNYMNCAAFIQPGSILVLEMDKRNYSLSEIARIAESENKLILSSYLSSNLESERLEVTIKLNSAQIQNVTAAFERFGYLIKATFDEEDFMDTLKNRYESLMSYLNV
jgi:predicted transcriptional regulator